MLENTSPTDNSKPKKSPRAASKIWHYKPDAAVRQAPYFELPFSLIDSLKYLYRVWRPFSLRFWLLLIAIVIWSWFTPSLVRAEDFKLDWMLEIGLRNLIIVLVVAGGLHLFLFTFRKQGDELRYDARPLSTKSRHSILVIRFGIICCGRWSGRCQSARSGNV